MGMRTRIMGLATKLTGTIVPLPNIRNEYQSCTLSRSKMRWKRFAAGRALKRPTKGSVERPAWRISIGRYGAFNTNESSPLPFGKRFSEGTANWLTE